MNLRHELFLHTFGLDRPTLLPPESLATIEVATIPRRQPLAERLGGAVARALDAIVLEHVGPNVSPDALKGRGNIVQRGFDGDYQVTLDGKPIGVIEYPGKAISALSDVLRYTVVGTDGKHQQRTVAY